MGLGFGLLPVPETPAPEVTFPECPPLPGNFVNSEPVPENGSLSESSLTPLTSSGEGGGPPPPPSAAALAANPSAAVAAKPTAAVAATPAAARAATAGPVAPLPELRDEEIKPPVLPILKSPRAQEDVPPAPVKRSRSLTPGTPPSTPPRAGNDQDLKRLSKDAGRPPRRRRSIHPRAHLYVNKWIESNNVQGREAQGLGVRRAATRPGSPAVATRPPSARWLT